MNPTVASKIKIEIDAGRIFVSAPKSRIAEEETFKNTWAMITLTECTDQFTQFVGFATRENYEEVKEFTFGLKRYANKKTRKYGAHCIKVPRKITPRWLRKIKTTFQGKAIFPVYYEGEAIRILLSDPLKDLISQTSKNLGKNIIIRVHPVQLTRQYVNTTIRAITLENRDKGTIRFLQKLRKENTSIFNALKEFIRLREFFKKTAGSPMTDQYEQKKYELDCLARNSKIDPVALEISEDRWQNDDRPDDWDEVREIYIGLMMNLLRIMGLCGTDEAFPEIVKEKKKRRTPTRSENRDEFGFYVPPNKR